MHPNFAERLFAELRRQPAREVLRWPSAHPDAAPASISSAALLARVQAWQHALEAHGPLPVGAPVLLAHPSSPELVAALLAVLGLGAVPVLPPAGASWKALYQLLKTEQIRLAVVAPGTRRKWAWLGQLLGCHCVAAASEYPDHEHFPTAQNTLVLRSVGLDQAALISHSSGSASGRPAAVRRSHRVLQAQHEALRQQFPPWAEQRDFPLFPNVILHNLAVGALSIVPDLPQGRLAQLDPARIVTQLANEQAETLTGNVFYFTKLVVYLRLHPTTFPAVRALGIGGSPVPENLLVAVQQYFPNATCHVIYGASEAEPIAVRTVAGPAPDPRLGYCVGRPHAGLSISLRSPQPVWQPVACQGITALGEISDQAALSAKRPYQSGEILVRGAHVAAPAGPESWLATGDFGYFDATGQLWLTGRGGAAQLVRGVGHYQLEHQLRHLPGVAQVAALPCADGSTFDVFFTGMTTPHALLAASEAAFGPGLLGQVQQRDQLPVDSRHFSKLRYDLIG